jgi:CRP/FNR family transcriptional regulator, cyclic AMP receptor protein
MVVASPRIVSVFDADPDLIEHLDASQAEAARPRGLAHVASLRAGDHNPWGRNAPAPGHLGFLVLVGLLTRNVTLLGRTSMDLVGAGDILRPWEDGAEASSIPSTVTWTVHESARLAVLDRHFAERVAPWPEIVAALVSRSARRSQWLCQHLAILENPRVDVRLMLLFWHLADRWGTVGREGVTVPLQLTHSTLGRLIRAQRPSVTASLHGLAERGLLIRGRDGAWLLHGDPRQELGLWLDNLMAQRMALSR